MGQTQLVCTHDNLYVANMVARTTTLNAGLQKFQICLERLYDLCSLLSGGNVLVLLQPFGSDDEKNVIRGLVDMTLTQRGVRVTETLDAV